MDIGLQNKDTVALKRGEILRLRGVAGRYIGVVRGTLWLTQDRDRRDHILCSGEDFRLDRSGTVWAMPLGGAAAVVLEEGLIAERRGAAPIPATDRDSIDLCFLWARLRHSCAMAWAFAGLADSLNRVWGRVARMLSAALQARDTEPGLRALNDHLLKDVGVRRDQFEVTSRRSFSSFEMLP